MSTAPRIGGPPPRYPLMEHACTMMRALELVSGRWSTPVLYVLHHAPDPVRFRELQRRIGKVTQKELTRNLRELERAGVVSRTVHPEVPPRVEYALTELGRSLVVPLSSLAVWAVKNGAQVEANRARYDARPRRAPQAA